MVSYKKYFDIEIFEGEISMHEYPWHFHNFYTLILVEKGLITYEFQDKNVKVEAKEVLIIEPLKIHRNIISQPTAYKAIFVPQEYLECARQNKIITQKLNHPTLVDNIVDMLNKIDLNPAEEEPDDFVLRLCELLNQLPIQQNEDFRSGNYIIPQIDYDLTVQELAKEAHLSKFHFQRKFKRKCGLTIGQLKQQEKTIAAKKLLEKGMLSTDVAHELGFFDQSHFIKYFKKMWATTPKNFK
jgi:AraC-like DNA-binding protein